MNLIYTYIELLSISSYISIRYNRISWGALILKVLMLQYTIMHDLTFSTVILIWTTILLSLVNWSWVYHIHSTKSINLGWALCDVNVPFMILSFYRILLNGESDWLNAYIDITFSNCFVLTSLLFESHFGIFSRYVNFDEHCKDEKRYCNSYEPLGNYNEGKFRMACKSRKTINWNDSNSLKAHHEVSVAVVHMNLTGDQAKENDLAVWRPFNSSQIATLELLSPYAISINGANNGYTVFVRYANSLAVAIPLETWSKVDRTVKGVEQFGSLLEYSCVCKFACWLHHFDGSTFALFN